MPLISSRFVPVMTENSSQTAICIGRPIAYYFITARSLTERISGHIANGNCRLSST